MAGKKTPLPSKTKKTAATTGMKTRNIKKKKKQNGSYLDIQDAAGPSSNDSGQSQAILQYLHKIDEDN